MVLMCPVCCYVMAFSSRSSSPLSRHRSKKRRTGKSLGKSIICVHSQLDSSARVLDFLSHLSTNRHLRVHLRDARFSIYRCVYSLSHATDCQYTLSTIYEWPMKSLF
ncbi:hypothetical protein SISSUDRAFT_709085 [Sistotremastrum suecicum HHB10207 ss-3]|uniref:Uncharacterized protein n=1 Tax=Sistotremastrum suecicum HHB10207 ss-3 TaxID=1314776 RepID=A0A166DUG3_9AGAM|nr:hypothetical protein SISSUDRAFT_709085 [Sistotremastrum suecicum HHB10207 ss-3]